MTKNCRPSAPCNPHLCSCNDNPPHYNYKMIHTDYSQTPIEYVHTQHARLAYRRMGVKQGTPIVFLNHLAANMDGCDPKIMNGLSQRFTVICFDYPGIGLSQGKAATSVTAMAHDTIALIRALGYTKVHLLGQSLGGFVAQAILQIAPQLVESAILAGTGPAGDKSLSRLPIVTFYDMLRGFLTGKDARYYLFFPPTAEARRQANEFLTRIGQNRYKDKPTSLYAFLRQLKAVVAWGQAEASNFSHIAHRVWVVNGSHDRMIPTSSSHLLAHRLPHSSLTIYEGAGHGAIFQEAELFVQQATAFYIANDSTINHIE